ncbi:MAG: hypothetical protein V7785_24950 [Bermanella sp.]
MDILQYFANDPMKLLYLVGGSGGVHYWINQWRYRNRLQVKIVSETYNDLQQDYVTVNLKVECINLGDMVVSLQPLVTVKAFCPEKTKRIFNLNVTSADRVLPPHEPKIIEFSERLGFVFLFTGYRRYRFSVSRGLACNKYVVGPSGQEINWVKYQLGKTLFRIFGIYPSKSK